MRGPKGLSDSGPQSSILLGAPALNLYPALISPLLPTSGDKSYCWDKQFRTTSRFVFASCPLAVVDKIARMVTANLRVLVFLTMLFSTFSVVGCYWERPTQVDWKETQRQFSSCRGAEN